MASKKHRPEEAVAKLRQVDVLVSQGQSVAEAIRAIGVTEVTYYRWRREFGGLKADQVKRLKELEAENARLRRAVSDLTLDKQMILSAKSGGLGEGGEASHPRLGARQPIEPVDHPRDVHPDRDADLLERCLRQANVAAAAHAEGAHNGGGEVV